MDSSIPTTITWCDFGLKGGHYFSEDRDLEKWRIKYTSMAHDQPYMRARRRFFTRSFNVMEKSTSICKRDKGPGEIRIYDHLIIKTLFIMIKKKLSQFWMLEMILYHSMISKLNKVYIFPKNCIRIFYQLNCFFHWIIAHTVLLKNRMV
jgi:hypothetical protein